MSAAALVMGGQVCWRPSALRFCRLAVAFSCSISVSGGSAAALPGSPPRLVSRLPAMIFPLIQAGSGFCGTSTLRTLPNSSRMPLTRSARGAITRRFGFLTPRYSRPSPPGWTRRLPSPGLPRACGCCRAVISWTALMPFHPRRGTPSPADWTPWAAASKFNRQSIT